MIIYISHKNNKKFSNFLLINTLKTPVNFTQIVYNKTLISYKHC